MTFGNAIAILISLAALYRASAFVSTKIMHRPMWPFKK
jgi:hypothetical protein